METQRPKEDAETNAEDVALNADERNDRQVERLRAGVSNGGNENEGNEADGAFVYKTDAMLARHAITLFQVPAHLYPQITYPLAITRAGSTHPGVRTVYDFLTGGEALSILTSFGFVLPDTPVSAKVTP